MWYVRLAARPTMVESEAVLLMVLHPVLLWEVLEAVQREFHPEALPREFCHIYPEHRLLIGRKQCDVLEPWWKLISDFLKLLAVKVQNSYETIMKETGDNKLL